MDVITTKENSNVKADFQSKGIRHVLIITITQYHTIFLICHLPNGEVNPVCYLCPQYTWPKVWVQAWNKISPVRDDLRVNLHIYMHSISDTEHF